MLEDLLRDSRVLSGTNLSLEERLRMCGAVRQATDIGRSALDFRTTTWRQIIDNTPLPDALEQADLLIEQIAKRTRSWGQLTTRENQEVWATRVFLRSWHDLKSLLDVLDRFIVTLQPPAPDRTVVFQLRFEGSTTRSLHKFAAANSWWPT